MATDHFDNMELLPEAPHSRVSSPPHFTGPTCRVGTVDPSLHSSSSPASPSAPQLNSSSDSTTGQESPGGWSRGRARNTVTGPCCPPEREGRRTRQAEERKREAGGGGVFAGPHAVPFRRSVSFSAMFPRVSTILPLRPLSRLPLCSGGPEASAAAIVLRGAPHGPGRYRVSFSAVGPAGLQAAPIPRPRHSAVILRLPGVDDRSHCFKSGEREIPET